MDQINLSKKRSFLESEVPNDEPSPKRVRFPKGKKLKTGEVALSTSQNHVGGQNEWDTDPLVVAKARSKRRSQMTTELFREENKGILEDISAAEVRNYEDLDNLIDDGIQIEPFNLEREREEGYFDASGNFVEYANSKEFKDAWLDSVEIDPIFLERAALEIDNEEDDNHGLSSIEIGKTKRRIADILESGETILQALKRLKGTSNNKKEKMPPDIKLIFDQLTDDAAKLMENGDYNVYNEKQDDFIREAEGYEKLARVKVEPPTSSGNGTAETFDMFGEDDDSPCDGEKMVDDRMNDPSSNMDAGSGSLLQQSDYVFDESSGYYYSSSLGYYYDPCSKLYCCASSGQWYSYNEAAGAYEHVTATAV